MNNESDICNPHVYQTKTVLETRMPILAAATLSQNKPIFGNPN